MMSLMVARQNKTALPRAGFVAALVLVLHWVALSVIHFNTLAASNETLPTLSTGARAAQPGALPRELPRAVSLESDASKSDKVEWPVPGDPGALVAQVAIVPCCGDTPSERVLGRVPPRSAPSRHFDPRAPPAMMA
jgi:hypothetical protein